MLNKLGKKRLLLTYADPVGHDSEMPEFHLW